MSIPVAPGYRSLLRSKDLQDERSDEDLFDAVIAESAASIVDEKNIWMYWDKGAVSIPPWCRRNVVQVARLNPGWIVRVLDAVPESKSHFLRFVSRDLLPKTLLENTMDGYPTAPHAADLLKGCLLYEHGGAWIDIGVFLFDSLDRICWNTLASPDEPHRIACPILFGEQMFNHFIAARRGDPFVKRWHDVFVYLWKDRTNAKNIAQSPLLEPVFKQLNSSPTYTHSPLTYDPAEEQSDYLAQIYCWMRVCYVHDRDFSGPDYWTDHVLGLEMFYEHLPAHTELGNTEIAQLLDLLSLPRAPRDHPLWEQAYNLTWRMLSSCSMQKLSRAYGNFPGVHLATLLDKPENSQKDCLPGTFGELLRYGSVHFEQLRKGPRLYPIARPDFVLRKGLLEV